MKISEKSMFASILPRFFIPGLLFAAMFAVRAEAIIPISDQDVIAARGWDMGACRIPAGPNTTAPVYFADGEIIGMPIHINNQQDNPDVRDIYIGGSPIFLEKVEMGESRYTSGGVDKYETVMACFQNGIYFDMPDVAINDEAAVQETSDRFRDSTNPTYRFSPIGTANVPYRRNAVQLEFFVDGGVGKVRITNNCSVSGSNPGLYDYEMVPASDGNTFQKYYIYDYHCKPASEAQMVIPIEDAYVTQEFDGYEGDPVGQIYVDGSVVIGGDSTTSTDMVVKGNITIVATGYIWVADSIFVDGPHDSNGKPTADNPNVLALIARRLIKIVNPTSSSSPSVPSGQIYQPIGITQSGYSGRFLPDPTIVEAAITIGGGGWGAEEVRNRREYSGPLDDLIVHGAIAEVFRGVVGLIGVDGYIKHYDYDRRLRKTSLFVLTPDGGENLISGNTYTIRWSSHSCISDASIEYSADDGVSWNPVNPPNAGNSGAYNWLVPVLDSDNCLVRVSETNDPNISDISDDVFTIFECIRDSKADLNNDCKVDLEDFSLFAEEWMFNGNPFDMDNTEGIYFCRDTGHYYELIITPGQNVSWSDANSAAESKAYKEMQGHLATIMSPEENQFVNLLNKQQDLYGLWLGGYQLESGIEPYGDWRWVTGEAWSYVNWDSGQPDNNGDEDYLIMQIDYEPSSGGKWNDVPDEGTLGGGRIVEGYVIEYE